MKYQELNKQELIQALEKLEAENLELNKELSNINALFTETTIGIYKSNLNGDIIEANLPLVKMLGYDSFEDLQQFNILNDKLIDLQERENFVKTIEDKRIIIGWETTWFRKDGSKIHIRESSRIVKDEKNEFLYFQGTVEDISEKKKQELELIESEKKFRTLIELMPDGFVVHKDSKIVYANKSIIKILKTKNSENLIGRNIFDFIHPGFHNIVKDRIENTYYYDKNVFTKEELVVTDDNEHLYIEVSSFPMLIDWEKHVVTIIKDITEKKKAESELQQSELTYRGMLNSINEAVFIQDSSGKIIDVNKAAEILFLHEHNYFIDKYPLSLAANNFNDFLEINSKIEEAYKGKKQLLNFWGENSNGEVFLTEISLSPGLYFDKRVVVAVLRDISERHKMEEQLRQSEKKYRELINFAVGGILIGTPNGDIIEANDYICKLFGKAKNQIIGKNINDGFFTSKSLQNTPLNYEKLKLGEVLINQRDIVRNDGRIIPVEMHTKMMPDKTYQSIYHDISERKTAEKLLLEAKSEAEKLNAHREALLKAIPDIIISIDDKGNILDFYSNYSTSILSKPENFTNKNITKVFSKDLYTFINAKMPEVLNNQKIENFTYTHNLPKDKKTLFFDIRLVFLNKNSILCLIRDNTDRIELIKDLEIAKLKAEENENLKSAFLANMSHEVRTPMNAIIGFADLLKNEVSLEEKTEYINIIQNSCNQLLTILDDIIELSKLESEAEIINVNSFNLFDIVKEVYESYFVSMKNKLAIEFVFNTLDINTNLLCVTDKVKTKQIISNLISNAIKYTEKGKIEFGYKELNSNEVEFYVKDTGVGISSEDIDKIFQRFVKLDNKLSKLVRGSGLGLSICKAYSDMLGGKITVTSILGEGSTFYYTFSKYTFA